MSAPTAVDHRFVPTSAQDYSRRAKHLAWITQRPLQHCQELLARAYGYGDAHELRAIMAAEHGSDEPQMPWIEQVGRQMQMANAFNHRILHVLAGGETPADLMRLSRREWLARDIGLTEPWQAHKTAFARVRNQILIASGEDPDALQGTTPLDYGRAYHTAAGDYTIALTEAGQAVRDVLLWWYEDEEGANPISWRAQRVRIDALRARHPANPWLVADAALTLGHALARDGDDSPEAWAEVLAEARSAISLFERILSLEQCTKYAGAKLYSRGFGFGNEAFSYPSTLYYAGVAALNTDHLREAIAFLERAYLADPGDGAGSRFQLIHAYAQRAGLSEPPSSWDELTFAHLLRAVVLIEAGDYDAGIAAFAYALVDRLWQQFNNGYEGAPRSLAALLKAATPVATGHAEAWVTLTNVASEHSVQRVVREFVTLARRSEYLDLDEDSESLTERIRSALHGDERCG